MADAASPRADAAGADAGPNKAPRAVRQPARRAAQAAGANVTRKRGEEPPDAAKTVAREAGGRLLRVRLTNSAPTLGKQDETAVISAYRAEAATMSAAVAMTAAEVPADGARLAESAAANVTPLCPPGADKERNRPDAVQAAHPAVQADAADRAE
jgi:hypothetical protein